MKFNIEGGVEEIYSCTECMYVSTKKHFPESMECPLCFNNSEKINEIEETVGMADFKYRKLLDKLEEDAAGVGSSTVESIENHFDDGDDFLDAAEQAYKELELSALTEVSGVGESSGKEIGLTMAEEEGWEEGAIFQF